MNRLDSRILSIFADALACDSPELRIQRLGLACGNDSALRAQVEELLNAHDEAGDFLKGSDAPACFISGTENTTIETAGTVIGPYKLLEQIGEGGMGIVYMAE